MKMLTGRFTYGLGQIDTQGDSTSVFQAFQQSTPAQTPPAQWTFGTWALVIGAGYVLWSVLRQTKQHVGRTRGYLAERRERLAREAEATADYYRAKKRH
jgi:hypothetical protein